jgi:hypothetical protein
LRGVFASALESTWLKDAAESHINTMKTRRRITDMHTFSWLGIAVIIPASFTLFPELLRWAIDEASALFRLLFGARNGVYARKHSEGNH